MTTFPSDGATGRFPRSKRKRFAIEWPTLFMLIACYATWFAAGVYLYPSTPIVALVVLGVAIALHSSLQHEVLRGHPTRFARVNEALVFLPLGLVYPYRSYKKLHLQHHADERLTDPYDDPESFYKATDDWRTHPVVLRKLLSWNNTLLGRVTLGPPLMVIGFTMAQWRAIAGGDRKVASAWLLHAAGLLPTVLIIEFAFGIPLWLYALTSAYLGISLISVRSFCEHQWSERADGRTIIVETSILAPLFLYNNLHFVHHKLPNAPWYRLPMLYRQRREEWRLMNEGYVFRSYLDIFKAFLFRSKEPVVHPGLRLGNTHLVTTVMKTSPGLPPLSEISSPEQHDDIDRRPADV